MKNLYSIILNELQNLDTIEILRAASWTPVVFYLREAGEIEIKFKTKRVREETVKERFFGLIKNKVKIEKQIPLSNFDEIREYLEHNPKLKYLNNHLEFEQYGTNNDSLLLRYTDCNKSISAGYFPNNCSAYQQEVVTITTRPVYLGNIGPGFMNLENHKIDKIIEEADRKWQSLLG
ncbi:hypothetical protein HYT57_00655 [Candidatus Woesearchaeota archaeon]|nr:hypothetical protein [Candidatus Woesearchaeota archaeon]